jgi:hypothetical protein
MPTPPWPADPVDLAHRLMAGPRAPEIPAGAALAGAVLQVGLALLEEVEEAAEALAPVPERRIADAASRAALCPGDRLFFGSYDVPSDLSDMAACLVSCALAEARDFRVHVAALTAPGLRQAAVENLACHLGGDPGLAALAARAANWPAWQGRIVRPGAAGRVLRLAGSPAEAERRLEQARALLHAARLLLRAARAGTHSAGGRVRAAPSLNPSGPEREVKP